MTGAQLNAFVMSFLLSYFAHWGQIPDMIIFTVTTLIAAVCSMYIKIGEKEDIDAMQKKLLQNRKEIMDNVQD